MKIQTKDFYHGAALTQLVEDPAFTALNKVDEKYGHYLVNDDILLIVKYASAERSPWHFTFNANDLETVQDDMDSDAWFFLCLVCGGETVCLLDEQEVRSLIIPRFGPNQSIKVVSYPGRSMRVSGSWGDIEHTIPHNRFPAALFE